ncbi:uncharacterized protein TOL2_C24410 [Desulfobacula toluolica Tol2]|uniref:Uncharacterized protein n=1 Tax=Desulfobacula toluolica (strain DSM 7467 / Tol2) TaxID=651182 RepID=K0NP85_DESTT|nr:uncharacterized protein TOL2_C24410 [Desulfobacula toluolica Tol2]
MVLSVLLVAFRFRSKKTFLSIFFAERTWLPCITANKYYLLVQEHLSILTNQVISNLRRAQIQAQ